MFANIGNLTSNVTSSEKTYLYKKLAPNALQFTYWNPKSCKTYEKKISKYYVNLLVKN